MTIAPEILDAMKDAGASIDVILAAIRADQALADKVAEERRAKDTERQRRHRLSRAVTPVTRDKCDTPPNEDILTPPRISPKPNGLTPRKHRLPDGWQPEPLRPGTNAFEIYSGWMRGRFEQELEKFRNHHTAAGTRCENWQSAWCKWIGNTQNFERGRYGQRNSDVGKTTAAIAALGGFNDDTPM